jgi:hypothetical protein
MGQTRLEKLSVGGSDQLTDLRYRVLARQPIR